MRCLQSIDERHTRGRFHRLLIIADGPAAALVLYREIRNNPRITPLPGKYYAVDVDVHRSDHPLRSRDPRHHDACWNRPAVDPSPSTAIASQYYRGGADRHPPRGLPGAHDTGRPNHELRSEEHTSELQSLMRISYAVFCLKKKIQ